MDARAAYVEATAAIVQGVISISPLSSSWNRSCATNRHGKGATRADALPFLADRRSGRSRAEV